MLHPHFEVKFINSEIGYGVFAMKDIPKGTITWVRDQLDRLFTPEEVKHITGPNLDNLWKYTYRDKNGNYVFCWDLTKFVNHSFSPNAMLTSLGFEIAIQDIKRGEELTNDYGTLNLLEPFKCAKGIEGREFVKPDDLKTFHAKWDKLVESAVKRVFDVDQPLDHYLDPTVKKELSSILSGSRPLPSVLENYFQG